MKTELQIECHPLEPFLPTGAKLLMLGSFPPKHERWSMEFFYPNFQNDMWRIMGIIFFNDKNHFITETGRAFCRDKVIAFCQEHKIALYDTARAVRRLKDNAADKFLEVVEPTDLRGLLAQIPDCVALVSTGEKATEIVAQTMQCAEPKVGSCTIFSIDSRMLSLYRMPSSSRAYPLSLERKADAYRLMFRELAII